MTNVREFPAAFTMTELLGVIAIIAILAALLLGGVAMAKHKAQSAYCLNNLHQLGTGLNMFLADHHVFPLEVNPGFWEGEYVEHSLSWISALRPYGLPSTGFLTRAGVEYENPPWHCPCALRPLIFPQNRGYPSYGYNAYGTTAPSSIHPMGLGGQGGPWPKFAPPVGEAQVLQPSDMIAIGDGFTGANGVVKDAVGAVGWVSGTGDYLGSTQRAYARHQGKANMVFCDGHTESPQLPTLFGSDAQTLFRRWNRDHQSSH